MENIKLQRNYTSLITFTMLFAFLIPGIVHSQTTTTIPTGSFIINMGITPQTIGNGLKPYGMVYDLIVNHSVTIIWSIEPSKVKDGIDFSHNGIDYKGGTFVIPANFRTPTVNTRITFWQGQGVVGATTVSPVTIPLYRTYNLQSAPRWTLDKKNGSIAATYFVNAGIPASAHGGSSSSGWKDPAELDCCDDLFVMPHADPIWSTHARLLSWNDECKGGIWAACHAPSALENMVNPLNRSQQTNFLTVKDPAWVGASGNYTLSNALILWGSHSNGTPPYTYRLPADPVAQFMGIIDAATQNGSEQIFMPRQGIVSNASTYSASAVSRWNPNAQVLVYDPTQANVTNPNLTDFRNVASVMVYGRGFDDENRGYVMYEAGHTHSKSTASANVAAQRAFFNFGFLVANDKAPLADVSSIPAIMTSGSSTLLSITVEGGSPPYTISWTSSCGGSFSPNNSSSLSTTFTAPVVGVNTPCNIKVSITDLCGRVSNISTPVVIQACNLTFNNTVTPVACFGQNNGSISMGITGSSGPFNWNWSRVSPAGTGMGTGTTISGLSVGTYNVTVSDSGGCSGTFTQLITQPNVLTVSATPTNYQCFGNTGSINLTVNGGNPGYTYNWADLTPPPAEPKDRTGLTAGSYSVTVTDTKGCVASTNTTVTGPLTPLSIIVTSKTDVTCNGANNGTISTSVSGGTPGYTYSWNDGNTNPNRTALSPGTYSLTVTDANGCFDVIIETINQPPVLTLSVTKVDPTCPPGANPPVNNDGSIDLTVNGGTPGYTYNWSTMDGSGLINGNEDQSGLTAGTYSVTVTDANGCQATISTTLTSTKNYPVTPTGINNN
jgi:hypothetical protein